MEVIKTRNTLASTIKIILKALQRQIYTVVGLLVESSNIIIIYEDMETVDGTIEEKRLVIKVRYGGYLTQERCYEAKKLLKHYKNKRS